MSWTKLFPFCKETSYIIFFFSASVVELEWTSVLVATSSSETRVNISDMYFNRQKKMNTSKEVFLDPSDLREVLVDRKLSGFRSCFIDAWGRAQYCETNQCNPDLDLLRVHGVSTAVLLKSRLLSMSFDFPCSFNTAHPRVPCDRLLSYYIIIPPFSLGYSGFLDFRSLPISAFFVPTNIIITNTSVPQKSSSPFQFYTIAK